MLILFVDNEAAWNPLPAGTASRETALLLRCRSRPTVAAREMSLWVGHVQTHLIPADHPRRGQATAIASGEEGWLALIARLITNGDSRRAP